MLETPSFVHNYSATQNNPKASIIDSYDLLGIRLSISKPTEAQLQKDKGKAYEQTAKQADTLFDQICTKTNCDIISIDLSRRLPFFVTKTPVKLALQRGAQFELDYGSGMLEGMAKDCRKCFIANALAITKHSKGKGVILAANVNRKVFMRAPLDLVHMGQLLGIS